jgi:hypothetical protein
VSGYGVSVRRWQHRAALRAEPGACVLLGLPQGTGAAGRRESGRRGAIAKAPSSGVDMGASALGRQRPPDAVGRASGKGATLSVGDSQLEGDLPGEQARIRAALPADVAGGADAGATLDATPDTPDNAVSRIGVDRVRPTPHRAAGPVTYVSIDACRRTTVGVECPTPERAGPRR